MASDLLIFDLDGTLIDSAADVGRALNRVLADLDIAPLDDGLIRTHVGYGIQPLLKETLADRGIDDPRPAFERFAAYYFEHCADETTLFDGVAEVLDAAPARAKVILTNKSNRFLEKILDRLGLARHFVASFGRESFAKTKPDPLPITSILGRYDVPADRTLMIGDTETDVNAGHAAGVATCLVTYGYGNPAVLAKLEPTYRAATPSELLRVVRPG